MPKLHRSCAGRAFVGLIALLVFLARDSASVEAVTVSVSPSFNYVVSDGSAGGYEAFPDVTRLNDGRIMAIFYEGYDHISPPTAAYPTGGRAMYVTSADEGATWSNPAVLYDTPRDDRDSSITQLPDGPLLSTYFTYAGGQTLGSYIVRSTTAGATWSTPQLLAPAPYAVSSPIRRLTDGRLVAPLYYEGQGVAYGAVALSDDAGVTWTAPVGIPNSSGVYLDAETDLIELNNGSLWAIQRSSHTPARFSTSTDRGNSWSDSQSLGFIAHSPYLMRTALEDMILLGYRGYDQSGAGFTALRYSLDEAASWSAPIVVDTTIGAYPSMVNLDDGSVLIAYYEEGAGSNIRARTIHIDASTGPVNVDATFSSGASLDDFNFLRGGTPNNAMNVAGGVWTNQRSAGEIRYWSRPGLVESFSQNIVHGSANIAASAFSAVPDDLTIVHAASVADGYLARLGVVANAMQLQTFTGGDPNYSTVSVPNNDGLEHSYGWELNRSTGAMKLFFDGQQVGNPSGYDAGDNSVSAANSFYLGDGTGGGAHSETWNRAIIADGPFSAAPLTDADFDGDGDVDGADLLVWQRGVGTTPAQLQNGDANGNDAVEAGDLAVWKSQFGVPPSQPSGLTVPEPSSVSLFVLGFALALNVAQSRAR